MVLANSAILYNNKGVYLSGCSAGHSNTNTARTIIIMYRHPSKWLINAYWLRCIDVSNASFVQYKSVLSKTRGAKHRYSM